MGVCVPQRQILISAPSKGFKCLNHVRSGRLYQRKKNARQRNNAACGKNEYICLVVHGFNEFLMRIWTMIITRSLIDPRENTQ